MNTHIYYAFRHDLIGFIEMNVSLILLKLCRNRGNKNLPTVQKVKLPLIHFLLAGSPPPDFHPCCFTHSMHAGDPVESDPRVFAIIFFITLIGLLDNSFCSKIFCSPTKDF